MGKEIIKSNQLIAEFMGAKFKKEDAFRNGNMKYYVDFDYKHHPNQLIKGAGRKFEIKDLLYHESWDWLMPVVEKIAEYRMAYPTQADWVCDCKIVVYQRILWREVVKFVEWHNDNVK